jgi:hypothetical protein
VVAQGRAGINSRAKVRKSLRDSSRMSRGEIRHSAPTLRSVFPPSDHDPYLPVTESCLEASQNPIGVMKTLCNAPLSATTRDLGWNRHKCCHHLTCQEVRGRV